MRVGSRVGCKVYSRVLKVAYEGVIVRVFNST